MPKQACHYFCNRGDCRKGFPWPSHLIEHLRIHDNKLIYCFYCPWGGAGFKEFILHMNHHFHIRTYRCNLCEKAFYKSAALKSHEERIHEKILDRYKCTNCSYVTHCSTNFFRHKTISHPAPDFFLHIV